MDEIKYMSISHIIQDKNYPFTIGQLRSFLINRDRNGLAKAVRKIGKRLYIRMDLFNQWIETQIDKEKS